MSHLGQRLSALVDGELSHQQRERVLAHLAHCAPCRQEAAALRMLKQRMHALGEATADTTLTDRLIAVAGVAGPAPWRDRFRLAGRRSMAGASRRRWPVRSLAVAGLTLAGLGVPAAAFLAGGGQQDLGPRVTPAIDMYVVQHDISGGNVPAANASSPPKSASSTAAPTPPPTAASSTAVPSTAVPSTAVPSTAASSTAAVPTAPAVPPALGDLPAAGAATVSARVAAALTRVAAVSSRVTAAATGVAGAGHRAHQPHPAMTPAGAR